MKLAVPQPLEADAVCRSLGYKNSAPASVRQAMESACLAVRAAAAPRWVHRRYTLQQEEQPFLAEAGQPLPGASIKSHLQGCRVVFLFAVTLGVRADAAIRAAETEDMGKAVLLDAAASHLAEQCAAACERELRELAGRQGKYLTVRFSPGYGDLPLALQRQLCALLDTPRTIGLTVSQSGLLLPRKSVTAICGVAGHPVTGRLAGCELCALRQRCDGTACQLG